jgi:hypothetical protein
MLMKRGKWEAARQAYVSMRTHLVTPNIETDEIMICGYFDHALPDKAMSIFNDNLLNVWFYFILFFTVVMW